MVPLSARNTTQRGSLSVFNHMSLVYFCNYVLGTYNDGITQVLYFKDGTATICSFGSEPEVLKFQAWKKDEKRIEKTCSFDNYELKCELYSIIMYKVCPFCILCCNECYMSPFFLTE